jgi:hypothetical protein
MSTVKLNHFTWVSIALIIFLWSCGGGDEPTKQEKVTKLLTQGTGKWQPAPSANSITLDGTDVEDELFPDFEITFTKTQITTPGASPVWPVSDTWTFKDKNADVIIRGSDDREIKIVSISSSQLIIQMEWDQTTYGGRTSSLPGLYKFVFNK